VKQVARLDVNIKSVALGKKEILRDISFAPENNSFVAVIGKNGSGKSTLLSAIAGLIPYDGSITADGVEVMSADRRSLAKAMAFIPQDIRSPHIRVSELVSYGRNPYRKFGEKFCENDRQMISEAIRLAELSDISDRYLDRISGGELRRAYFGMMLAQGTGITVLDEATAFMDADFEHRFVMMQKELSKTKTVVSVMHNLSLAVAYADTVLLLDGGRCLFYGSPDELLSEDIIERTFSVKRYSLDGINFFA
jgi:iron complex transport system ATP-binding protein